MARYKVRLPADGDLLYDEGGSPDAVVAHTRELAVEIFRDELDAEDPVLIYPEIARGYVLYKRDIDNGDGWEGAEPGDTAFTYRPDRGDALADNEVRVWMLGPPPVSWQMQPLPSEPVAAEEIPVGVTVFHRRLGNGVTVAQPRRVSPGRVIVDVEFCRWHQPHGGWEPYKTLACSVAVLSVLPTADWPQRRYRLTVAGEHIADGTEPEMQDLRRQRIEQLDAAWRDRELAELRCAEPSV